MNKISAFSLPGRKCCCSPRFIGGFGGPFGVKSLKSNFCVKSRNSLKSGICEISNFSLFFGFGRETLIILRVGLVAMLQFARFPMLGFKGGGEEGRRGFLFRSLSPQTPLSFLKKKAHSYRPPVCMVGKSPFGRGSLRIY